MTTQHKKIFNIFVKDMIDIYEQKKYDLAYSKAMIDDPKQMDIIDDKIQVIDNILDKLYNQDFLFKKTKNWVYINKGF